MRWRYYTGTNQTVIQLVIGGALSRLRKLKDVGQPAVVVVVVVVVVIPFVNFIRGCMTMGP